MQCPSCKEPIDNDSFYCDLCGAQIMMCPQCGAPRKGKFCSQCNSELVPAGNAVAGGATQSPTTSPSFAPVQPGTAAPGAASGAAPTQAFTPPPAGAAAPGFTPAQTFSPPPASGGAVSGGKLKLSSAAQGIAIEAGDGDIIGRKAGNFVNVFNRFNFISGTHCKIVKIGAGWGIMDLGSTNGTFVQGSKLAPNTPVPVSNGSSIKIADVELLASCDDGGGTSRL